MKGFRTLVDNNILVTLGSWDLKILDFILFFSVHVGLLFSTLSYARNLLSGDYLMNLDAMPKHTIVAYQGNVGNKVRISLLCADTS